MLMRTDPFRDLDRLTSQVLGTAGRPVAMPLDARQLEDELLVDIDLPGVDPASIDLTVERNLLTVRAERRRADDEGQALMSERPHGTFRRQLLLGDTLDTDDIEAAYADGVLHLRIPIADRAKPRRVPVRRAASTGEAATPIEATASGTTAPDDARELVGSST